MKPVSPTQGESGYFSSPDSSFDPHLFSGDAMRPEIKRWILSTLYGYWETKYTSPRSWSTVWVAGSGVSYQWQGLPGNGDIDVLIGVDYDEFFAANPKFVGMSAADLSDIFNSEMHADLWPRTEGIEFNDPSQGSRGMKKAYDVTFYVNPNSTDIRDINPYAAYNVTAGEWTVRPPQGRDFEHPGVFYKHAEAEAQQARSLLATHNGLASRMSQVQPGTPGWHNLMSQAQVVVSQAATLYDSIHLGRKQAFAPGGSGYGDYYNFRWQYHKQQGTAQALNAVAGAHKDAQQAYAQSVYGAPLEGADLVLRRAAMWNRGGNGR